VVDDVKPFEEAKLRMLNGSHTAMALMGAVQGWPTVADGVANADMRWFVRTFMTDMVMPHLQRPGLPAYRDALLARFANPDLHHKVHQIATDSSLKIPLRWLPTLHTNGWRPAPGVEPLAFATAVWMRYLLARRRPGPGLCHLRPAGESLQAIARQHRGDAPGTVAALLAQPPSGATPCRRPALHRA
jgi:fructuronate reductase